MKPRSVLVKRSQEAGSLEVSVDFLHDGGRVGKAQIEKAARDTLREALEMLEDSSARVERGGFREGRQARTEMLLVEMEGGAP